MKITPVKSVGSLFLSLAAAALLCPWTPLRGATIEGKDEFESKVLPVLQQRCFECHSHCAKIKGGLALDCIQWRELCHSRLASNEFVLRL